MDLLADQVVFLVSERQLRRLAQSGCVLKLATDRAKRTKAVPADLDHLGVVWHLHRRNGPLAEQLLTGRDVPCGQHRAAATGQRRVVECHSVAPGSGAGASLRKKLYMYRTVPTDRV